MNKQFPLPHIVSPIAPDLRRFLDRVKESFDDPDGLVTKKDLVDTGVFRQATGPVLEFLEPGEEIAYFTPPAPTNLIATGAMTSIVLTWSGVGYNTGYAYTEVWRANVDNLGIAVLIGTVIAGMYADAVGSDSSHYYWIRMVNVNDEKGPFNSAAGVAGATSPDLEYVFSQLTQAHGSTSDAPFFQLDTATVINGVTIPAGTYIKSAQIFNGTITNAKIGTAAIDSVKIADASIVTAKIANLAVTDAQIGNLNASKITAGTIAAARIGATSITAGKLVVTGTGAINAGTVGALPTSLYSTNTTTINGANITTGTITTNKLTVTPTQTFRQGSFPQSNIGEGDLWIHTSNNNTIYRYDGRSPYADAGWIISEIDVVDLVNSGSTTIVGNKISTGTITATHIDSAGITANKLNVNGPLVINSTSNNIGSFQFHKSTFNDYNTPGVFVGNRAGSGTATFLAGNLTSYILADETGVTIVGADVHGLNTLSNAPTLPGSAITYTSGGPHRFDFASGTNAITFQMSGGGGGGGGASSGGGANNGGTGGTTTLKIYNASDALQNTFSIGGGGGGAGNYHESGGVTGESFGGPGSNGVPSGANAIFSGSGGAGAGEGNGSAGSGNSAGGGGAGHDRRFHDQDGGNKGLRGSFLNNTTYTVNNVFFYAVITLGSGGSAGGGSRTGGTGSSGAVVITVS